MIQASELRIGNIVWDDENNPVQVERILSQKCLDWEGIDPLEMVLYSIMPYNGNMYNSTVNPIPLSPEVLEQWCGFKYGVSKYKDEETPIEDVVEFWDKKTPAHKYEFQPFTFTIVKWYKCEFTFSHHGLRSNCQYLHQLQNIYFALTGTELDVKLPSPLHETENK